MVMAGHWLFALLLAASTYGAALSSDCPSGWKGFGESCYLLVLPDLQTPPKTWEDSRAICLGYGGDLVSIANLSEVDFIFSLTKSATHHKFWIGLFRNKTTSNPKEGWIWSDGTNFTNPQQWHSREPNNYGNNENCAELYYNSKKWNDNDCSKKYGSICERRKGLPHPTIPTSGTLPPTKDPPPTCDLGWEAYNRSCYKFEKVLRKWDEARRACRDTGGHLVKVDDVQEQNYLTHKVRQFRQNLWVGLNDIEVPGRWVWEYHSKDLVKYKNWQSGEPNGLGKEQCVEMYGNAQAGFWNDAGCSARKWYICEKEEGKNVCPENWVPYNDSCYQFNTASIQQMTWNNAKNACRLAGGFSSLVTIKSQDEQDFIKQQVQASSISEIWIGLDDTDIETVFKWSDNSLLSDTKFAVWANGKPSENQDGKDCVLMIAGRTDGAWSVQDCSLRRNFICSRKRDLAYCNTPLGMENGNIPDSQITASSSRPFANGPEQARFRNSNAWCPAKADKNEFLQVDLGSLHDIRSVIVEGNVTSFSLRYGRDGKTFRAYSTSPLTRPAPTRPIKLTSVTARFVRIYPVSWTIYPCLTLELIGCIAQASSQDCDGNNWEKGPGNLCYQINRNYETWTAARSVCLDQGGDLLSITTLEEKTAIKNRIKLLTGVRSLWISLSDRDFLGSYLWSTGEATGLFSWGSGSPKNPNWDKSNIKSCIEIETSSGTWSEISCNSRRPFICMKGERKRSNANVAKSGLTGVWMSSARYYWPLASVENGTNILGTTAGTVYGTVNQTAGVKNISNSALKFSGSGSYIDAGDLGKQSCLTFPDACKQGLTISFMASFDQDASSWQKRVNVLDSVGNEATSVGAVVYVLNNQLWFVVSKISSLWKASVTITGDLTWRHYVMTWNESGINIYVNGQLITSKSKQGSGGPRVNKRTKFLIGIRAQSKVTSGQLNLAMVAVWERVLTKDVITSIYRAEFGRCPSGWVEFGMSCYQFNTDGRSYSDATRQCQSLGGDLIAIDSDVEQSFVSQQLDTSSWIGVSDSSQEAVFKQPSNDVIKYSNWNGGEPNNYWNREDCIETLKGEGAWNDKPCYMRYPYICEKSKELSVKPANISTSVAPKFRRICHYSRARIGCPVGFVIKVQFAFWGRRRRDLCRYISYTNCGISSIATTTKTVQSQCDNKESCELHASEAESYLSDPCPKINKYLEVNYTCGKRTSASKCGPGWKISRDNKACYRLFNAQKTWKDARVSCQSNGAELISIAYSFEQFVATSLMERTWNPNVWIGLNDLKTKGKYQWSDGSPVTWTNWYVGQPDERRTDKSCVYMSLYRSKKGWMFWRDQNCTSTFGFICKKILDNQQKPTNTPTASTGICPSGWTSSSTSYCYRVLDKPTYYRSWPDARKYCKDISSGEAELASISNTAENDFIRSLSNDTLWVGLETRGVFRGHLWSDKKPVAYTNWDIGQPDSYNGLEACVQLNPDTGYWSDADCYTRQAFVCQRQKSKQPATTPAPTTFPTSGSRSCKPGWTLYKGMCYIAGNDSARDFTTWHEAEAKCRSMNGHLVSINSAEEKAFLMYFIKNKKSRNYWIGLNDIGSESEYKWSDGSGYGRFIDWNVNEPNDHYRQEDCVEIYRYHGRWNDQHCSRKMSYICKSYNVSYHPLITIGPPRPTDDLYCPFGWVVNGQWCYEFHTEPGDYKTWDAARQACEKGTNSSKTGELVSIADELEEAFITIKIRGAKAPLWTGMNNRHGVRSNVYYWVDNSPAKYFKWNTREPRYGYGKCVEIVPYRWAAGRWNSVYCSKKNGYICKTAASRKPITATPPYTPTPTRTPSFTCPQNYKSYESSCYKFITTRKTFDDARKTCNNENGELMSIDSQFKQAYLVYLLERFKGNVWIGLLHDPYSSFKFTDHTSPVYTYWGAGQPSRQLDQRSCTQANITGSNLGRWDDVDCSQQNAFVCEIYNGEPKITITINSTCPQGWKQYRKFCYKHFDVLKTWGEAQYACSALGSNLVSIHDDQEQDFLIYYYQEKHPVWIWTGLNDRNTESGYRWVDKTGMDYVNWRRGEPNDRSGSENCVEMQTRSGQWNDLGCNYRRTYMCKHKLVCSLPLPVDPSMIEVKESVNASLGADQAIIQDDYSNDLAWCTNDTSGNANIKIDLNSLVKVTKISIQGRRFPVPQFVKSFRIDYERDENWQKYTFAGFQTIIQGNRDGNNVVTRTLERPITLDGMTITPVTWQGEEICMKVRLHGCGYVCQNRLIKPPGKLKADFITASSAKYPANEPRQASQRGKSWCAKANDKQPWIQVNFDNEQLISKIRTFGDRKNSYVKSYHIKFSGDGDSWTDYQEHGTPRIFKGNSDALHPMVHVLGNSIEASYIRIVPLTWNNNVCMRFALLGCRADCDKPLVQNAQDNKTAKISSSDEDSHPEYAIFKSGKAWCTSRSPLESQYLQIDFGKRYRLTKIATQGSPLTYGKARSLSSFTVKIESKKGWFDYLTEDKRQTRIFVAVNQNNPSQPATNSFSRRGLKARQIRIIPKDFNGTEICLRVEIYGCPLDVEVIPTTPPTKQNIFNVSVRFTSIEWNDNLRDKNSDEFKQASKKIEDAVEVVYKDSESFRRVNVKKLSKGSVVAEMELVFNPKFSNGNDTGPLQRAVASGKVGALVVDKESFNNIGDSQPQATKGNKKSSGLSGGAVAGVVIAVIFLCLAIGGGFLFYRRRQYKQFAPQYFENPISYSSKAYDMDD